MRVRSRENQEPDLRQAAVEPQPSLWREFAEFLVHRKRWWLTPIIVILLVLGLFIGLTGTAISPFIYALF